MAKITFMGAGSTVFARNVLGDAMCSPVLAESEINLYDIDGSRLKESEAILTAINKGSFKIHVQLQDNDGYTVYEIADLNTALSMLLKTVRAGGKTIADLKIERPTLEDSFLNFAKPE